MAGSKQPIDLLLHKKKLGMGKHLTKKEIAERKESEIKAPSDNVKPPTFLPNNLKREFKKIAKQLIDIGIMTNLDSDALARYLVAQEQYERLSVRLLDIDPLDEDFDTVLKHQDKFYKQARAAGTDLGLTISSRCKLVVPPKAEKEKPKTKEESLFGEV